MDNVVPVLVQVLYCGMLHVEYNIKAYNVVCGMIRLGYVPSILLVVSKINTTNNNNNLFCLTKKMHDLFHATMRNVYPVDSF